jgi:hypothetical protein
MVRQNFDADFADKTTTDLTEGTNLYHTTSRARSSISITDAGGDGSLAYNSGTGVITYTGPSASEVRAHISAGTGISFTSGVIANTGVTSVNSVTGAVTAANLTYRTSNSGWCWYKLGCRSYLMVNKVPTTVLMFITQRVHY